MARSRRRSSDGFSPKKFFRDYPIVPITAIVLGIGVLLGYWIGQSNLLLRHPHPERTVSKPEAIRKTLVSIPVSMAAIPESIIPKQIAERLAEQERILPTEKGIPFQPFGKKIEKPHIVFVIDDVGYNKRYADLLFSLDPHVTLAILPQLPYSKFFAEEGKKRGFPTILHLPLEPENEGEDPGPGEITARTDTNEIKAIIEKDLTSVPGVIGANNHMGSHATRDRGLMYLILKEFKRKNLFFLDSMTHPNSIGYKVAYALDMPILKRDVFLDNVDDYNYVMDHINETAQIAKETGVAVAIGHYRQNTLSALKKAIPRLEAEGFELATLTDIT